MRDGQKVTIYDGGVTTLTGKRGTLTIRDRNEWVDVSNENTRDGYPHGVGIGTWKVVRGTGQYAGVVGKGRMAMQALGTLGWRATRASSPLPRRCTQAAHAAWVRPREGKARKRAHSFTSRRGRGPHRDLALGPLHLPGLLARDANTCHAPETAL